MNKIYTLLFCIFLFPLSGSAQSDDEKTEAYLLRASYDSVLQVIDGYEKRFGNFQSAPQLCMDGMEASLRLGNEKLYNEYYAKLPSITNNPFLELRKTVLHAEALLSRSQSKEAEKLFLEALQLSDKSKDRSQEGKIIATTGMGLYYWSQGNEESAREFWEKAWKLKKETFGEESVQAASGLSNLLLLKSEDNSNLDEKYLKIIHVYEKAWGELHPSIAVIWNNLGLWQMKNNFMIDAEESLKKSLEIRLKNYSSTHPSVAFSQFSLARFYKSEKKYSKAISFGFEALENYKKLYGKKHTLLAQVYNFLGLVAMEQQDIKKGVLYFHEAMSANIPSFNSADSRVFPSDRNALQLDVLMESYLLKGRALEALHHSKTLKLRDLKDALRCLDSAITLVDAIRELHISTEDKLALGASASEMYLDGIRICFALAEGSNQFKKYHEKAFQISEKGKSALLLQSISDVKAKEFAGIPSTLLEDERMILDKLSYFERALSNALDENSRNIYSDSLFVLKNSHRKFLVMLETEYPRYYELKYQKNKLELSQIQACLSNDQIVASYVINEVGARVYIFLLTKKGLIAFDRPLKENWQNGIKGIESGIQFKNKNIFSASAHEIYQLLIPKVMEKYPEWIIIPEGILSKTPFEVLLSSTLEEGSYEEMSFVVKKHAVSYAYSTTLFLQQRNGSKEISSENMYLCAPVDFSGSSLERMQLSTLPGSEAEVKAIQEMCSNQSLASKLLLNKEAQESLLKKEDLSKYQLIHLATHGYVDEDHPELSRIYLSESADTKEDGILYSGEIYALKLNAKLITLSACQTGLGKVHKGEGIMGLSRALLYAGAGNILVSFWSVSDASTSELMQEFYKDALQTQCKNKNLSLQKAKKKLIQSKEFSAPYYWAAFVLIGS